MSPKTCFICQAGTKSTTDVITDDSTLTSSNLISFQDVVFLLRILFKVPHQVVVDHFVEDENHHPTNNSLFGGNETSFLKLCEVCEESVEHAKSVHNILVEAVNSFRKVQNKLTERLKVGYTKKNCNSGRLKRNAAGIGETFPELDTGGDVKLRKFIFENDSRSGLINEPFQIEDFSGITKDIEVALQVPSDHMPPVSTIFADVNVKLEGGLNTLTPVCSLLPGMGQLGDDQDSTQHVYNMESGSSLISSAYPDPECYEDEDDDDGEMDEEEEILVSDLERGNGNEQLSVFVQDRISLPISANHNSQAYHDARSTQPMPSSSSSSSSTKKYYYNHKCEVCGRSFSRPNKLRKHMVSQHGVGLQDPGYHTCHVCNSKFKQRPALREHMEKWRGQCKIMRNWN